MTAWFALLKKEMRLGSRGFFTVLILQLSLFSFVVYEAVRSQSTDAVVAVGFVAIMAHIFYLLGYMIVNLFLERKTFHLWLHNPLPAWSLLAAKLTSGILYMTVSMIISCAYTWIGYIINFQKFIRLTEEFHLYRNGFFVIFHLYLVAVFIGIIYLFFWCLYQVLKTRLGKWVWAVVIAGLFILPYLLGKIADTGILSFLTNWGRIPQSVWNYWLPRGFSIGMDSAVYVGDYVFDFLLAAVLFYLSAWLINRKIEVS